MTSEDRRPATERLAHSSVTMPRPKPLLRGWFHAAATLGALIITITLVARTWADPLRCFSLLIFGLSMIELYGVSALYHIGNWEGGRSRTLRAIDHANIFVLIAGTYTPICVNLFAGRLRMTVLSLIWTLALAGVLSAVLTLRLPRWGSTALYIGMGWIAIGTLPWLIHLLPWPAFSLLGAGGILYSIGAVIYARKRPNPLPQILGFHELFHLFTLAGGAAFVIMIWIWVVPFTRN